MSISKDRWTSQHQLAFADLTSPYPQIAVHDLTDGIYGSPAKFQAGEMLHINVPFPFDLDPAELLDPEHLW